MQNETRHARAAAVWIVHAACLAKMLRAHGRETHATNLEAAMNEVSEIIAREVGREPLSEAIGWVTDQIEEFDVPAASLASRH